MGRKKRVERIEEEIRRIRKARAKRVQKIMERVRQSRKKGKNRNKGDDEFREPGMNEIPY